MARLRNKTIEKLVKEGRVSHIPIKEVEKIYLKTREKIEQYKIILIKRTHASYILAGKLVYNS